MTDLARLAAIVAQPWRDCFGVLMCTRCGRPRQEPFALKSAPYKYGLPKKGCRCEETA